MHERKRFATGNGNIDAASREGEIKGKIKGKIKVRIETIQMLQGLAWRARQRGAGAAPLDLGAASSDDERLAGEAPQSDAFVVTAKILEKDFACPDFPFCLRLRSTRKREPIRPTKLHRGPCYCSPQFSSLMISGVNRTNASAQSASWNFFSAACRSCSAAGGRVTGRGLFLGQAVGGTGR